MSVQLANLTVSYQRRPAVHHVNIRFEPSLATAIVGPNGAGKSTLLKTIAGILSADDGQIVFEQCSFHDLAYLPQKSEIDLSMPMTVFELVSTGLWYRIGAFRGLGRDDYLKIENALVQVGLQDFAQRPLSALSMGQLQRVLFARILAQDARVILLDEPFNAVDAKTTEVLLQLIARWQTEGRTIIAVLHDFEQVKCYFQRALLLAHEVFAYGKPAQVLNAENLLLANERCAHWFSHADVCTTDEEDLPSLPDEPHSHAAQGGHHAV